MNPGERAWRSALAFAAITLVSMTLPSCRHDTGSTSDADASILVASGGGYTGAYSGYRVWRNGRTEYWLQQAGQEDNVTSRGVLGVDTVDYLFARLRYIGFHNMNVMQPGNLTKVIRYVSGGVAHEARWGDVKSTPPPELQAYYQDVLMLMQSRFPVDR